MENKNQKSVIIVLSIVIIILMATCMFFATDKINLKKDNKTETNVTEEKENKDNTGLHCSVYYSGSSSGRD